MEDKTIVFGHIVTENMLADPLTKGLRPAEFNKHAEGMGICSLDVLC